NDYDNKKKLAGKSAIEMIIGQDGFGVDDKLSCLPQLCMLKIFKNLTRMDLFNMMTVNKRMLPFYSDPSLDIVKWKEGRLVI
ncbi:hypothetical protein PENTCL1PPCAC_1622, partial [Pristionchus entomophagus]